MRLRPFPTDEEGEHGTVTEKRERKREAKEKGPGAREKKMKSKSMIVSYFGQT